jgi:hypothetical protein
MKVGNSLSLRLSGGDDTAKAFPLFLVVVYQVAMLRRKAMGMITAERVAYRPIRLYEYGTERRNPPGLLEHCAVIKAYFDDSSDDRRSKYIAVGGFVSPISYQQDPSSPRSALDHLELLWLMATTKLKEPFRSTNCETRNGEFKDWDRQDCNALMRELTSLLVNAPIVAFGIVVPVQEFRLVFPSLKGDYAPYRLAVQYVMAALANYCHDSRNDVSLVFEDSNAATGLTLEEYSRLKGVGSWPGSARLSGIDFKDKRLVALQAADLLAREAFKHLDNIDDQSRATRKPLQRLLGKYHLYCVTPQALVRLRDELGWPQEIDRFAREATIK